MKYEYQTAIIENVIQSLQQGFREGEPNTQEAGKVFRQFMDKIGDEGWEIVAVTPLPNPEGKLDQVMYTLKRPVNQ